ncbi:MAG: GDP-L-fucose synthase [Desulfomonile tiedjei]|nr:GDP-L-fucose synthase [Desulfomonile tiedjei]
MPRSSKVYVAGHTGLVGSVITRKLKAGGYDHLVVRSHAELDLENQGAVERFFEKERPEYIFAAAAKVGGIHANNTYRAEFLYKNLQIQNNLIHFAWKYGAKKLLFLASNCVYPKESVQPLKEEYLLTGLLEPTNEPYAVAKIAGMKMCESYNRQYGANFISAIPANVYGPNDNYDSMNSHLVAALIAKFDHAVANKDKQVELWGTGKPLREVIYVDDLADACLFLMHSYDESAPINVGTGKDFSVREIAGMVGDVTGFQGDVTFDSSKPDGMYRKLLDVSRIHKLGWVHKTELNQGLQLAYDWFRKHVKSSGRTVT